MQIVNRYENGKQIFCKYHKQDSLLTILLPHLALCSILLVVNQKN